MKRSKPSGSQFRKKRENKLRITASSKEFMMAFIERKSNSQCPNILETDNKESTSGLEMDVVNNDVCDEPRECNAVSTSNCESVEEVQLSDSINDIIVNDVSPCNLKIKNDTEQNVTQDNVDRAALQDIGVWTIVINQSFRDLMVSKGTYQLQNKNSNFPEDGAGRSLSKHWFDKTLKNGEKMNRTWMCFSPTKQSLFCFCCTLFPQKNCQSSFSSENGFSSWRKLNPRIPDHENSHAHRSAFLEWKELERRLNKGGLIDDSLQKQITKETKTWREILERIIATVQTLAQQNLAFRGHRESIIDDSNPGNFLALLKYLAKFDPIMRLHLDSISGKSGCLSYISPDIQNEIIYLLGEKVRKSIISASKEARYFSIILDTTPDVAHVEQMSQIIRFVEIKKNSVSINEAFIDFIPLEVKTAEGITEVIKNKLKRDGLDISDLRGQSYDNQATMAGVHSGVQNRILDSNPLAVFVPCDNHSLNLVGVHAAHVNVDAVTFFGTVQRLFTFFSCSTHRWSVLKQFVNITVKGHCDTRWSSKADAVKAISTQLDSVIAALEKLRDTKTETIDTRDDAALIINAIENFSFVALLFFWTEILCSFDKVQKILQTKGISFNEALILLQTLTDKLSDWRNELCDDSIAKAEQLCNEWGVNIVKRVRRKRTMPGENSDDAALSTQQEMRRSLIEIVDKLSVEISSRFCNLTELEKRFGFLCKFEAYINNTDISYKTQLPEINIKCTLLSELYPDDLNSEELFSDIKDVRILLKRAKRNGEQLDFTPKGLLLYISSLGLDAYKTLVTALKIFLTLPVAVASCERSFSKLKLIKSYLRSTMSQDRLSNLAILSIESAIASSLDYSDIITDFASIKARKVKF